MQCPQCESQDSKVIESRDLGESCAIRRRRECLECDGRYTTYERIERPRLMIIKKDQSRERFDRSKVMNGLVRACEKRPVSSEKLEALADDVERALHEYGEEEVASEYIGELVMERLVKIDEVAYVRFASVYRSFTDLDSFEKELSKLKKRTA